MSMIYNNTNMDNKLINHRFCLFLNINISGKFYKVIREKKS